MARAVAMMKAVGVALLFLLIAACLATVIVPPFLDRIYYEGPASRHYDGARFFNPDGAIDMPAPPGTSRQGLSLIHI